MKTEISTNDCSTINYCEIVPMTFEERYRMYMRCKKEELAKMLAQRDEYEQFLRQPCVPQPYYPPSPLPQYPTYPQDPYHPLGPWVTYATNNEQTNISE